SSTLLIHYMGGPEGENFWLNVVGVIIAVLSLSLIYNALKHHPFFSDIIYVRDLKSQMNTIYRKQRKLKEAAQGGDAKAIAILDFSHRASEYVYLLDNNTLTLEELRSAHREVLALAQQHLNGDIPEYQRDWLENV
ncbi:MAG: DUF3087 family protein, partial [Pseudomonadales bacterium]